MLVSTLNEDGTANLAPISSAFWLGWRGVIGIAASSQTTRNLLRTGECVLNLPSSAQAHAVDRIARTTGTCPVPDGKRAKGYVYEPDKFGTAGHRSGIANRRAAACARMPGAYGSGRRGHARIGEETPDVRGHIRVFELRVQRVHVHPYLLMDGHADRIDPDKWSPLIMSFQKFYGLTPHQVHASRLAEIPERAYRSPDIERSRDAGVPAGAGR